MRKLSHVLEGQILRECRDRETEAVYLFLLAVRNKAYKEGGGRDVCEM